MVDPGEWQLCLPPDGRNATICQGGYVAPGGELALRVVADKRGEETASAAR